MTNRFKFPWATRPWPSLTTIAPFGVSLSLHAGVILYLSLPAQQQLYVRTGVPEIRITLQKGQSKIPVREVTKAKERPIIKEEVLTETTNIPIPMEEVYQEEQNEGSEGIEGMIASEGVDSAPFLDEITPRFAPTPRYPRQARQRGQEGFVRLKVAVSGMGVPLIVELIESSGYDLLDREAMRTLKLWRFSPTHRRTEISYWTEKTVQFRLDD